MFYERRLLMTSKSRSRQLKRHTPPSSRKQSAQSPATQSAILSKDTLRAYLITLAIGGCLILLCSLGAYFHPDPASIIHPLAYVAAALTAFLGGWVAGKLRGNAPAVCGLANGILLTCTMLLLSFFFLSESSGYSALISTLLHAAIPVLSFLGALVGTRKKKTHTKRR